MQTCSVTETDPVEVKRETIAVTGMRDDPSSFLPEQNKSPAMILSLPKSPVNLLSRCKH